MKSQCSQNLSFLISGFFPNYFQINSQLIHKDEIWLMTYNPKHVVILLPISWFHGGLNKHHMWQSVFLCINDPGNPWHHPALPHHQQLNNGSTKVWWNGFFLFHVCILKSEKDSQEPHSVTVLASRDLVCLPLVGASPQVMNKLNSIFPQPLWWLCKCCSTQTQLTKDERATKFPELC